MSQQTISGPTYFTHVASPRYEFCFYSQRGVCFNNFIVIQLMSRNKVVVIVDKIGFLIYI